MPGRMKLDWPRPERLLNASFSSTGSYAVSNSETIFRSKFGLQESTMNFLSKFLKIVSVIPALVMGFESLIGAKKGQDKATEVLNIAQLIVQDIPESEIKDKNAFNDGLKKINDGVVQALNASLWWKG